VVEFLALAVVLMGASLLLGWRKVPVEPNLWDLKAIGANYTVLTITLAGFAIASVFFLATEGPHEDNLSFATIAGILLLAYLILTGAAIMFGSMAHIDSGQSDLERVSFCFAVVVLLQGVAAAWIAIHPLLILVELGYLAHTFSWILVAALFAGSSRPGVFLNRLAGLSGRVAITAPVFGFAAAFAYDFALTAFGYAPDVIARVRLFSVSLFVLALVGFVIPPLLHLLLGAQKMVGFRQTWAHRILSVYYQMTVLTIASLLIAVAFPNS